jgi:hypothetical protein
MSLSPMKDLLRGAMTRNRIANQITSSQIVEVANRILPKMLPDGREKDARVTSFKNKILKITVKNSSSKEHLMFQESDIVARIRREFPEIKIEKIGFSVRRKNTNNPYGL